MVEFAPLPTALTDDGHQISEIRLVRMMRWLRESGPVGWVVCTDAGEFPTLSLGERKQVLEIVAREAAQGGDVWVNVSAPSTAASLDLAQHADRHGAIGVILSPPEYGPYSDDEMLDYYHVVARHGHLQVFVVDPTSQLSPGLRKSLEAIPDVDLTGLQSKSTSWFQWKQLKCRPLRAVGIAAEGNADTNLLLEKFGSARFIKTALEELEIEAGPLRGPLKTIRGEDRNRLAIALQSLRG